MIAFSLMWIFVTNNTFSRVLVFGLYFFWLELGTESDLDPFSEESPFEFGNDS